MNDSDDSSVLITDSSVQNETECEGLASNTEPGSNIGDVVSELKKKI